jgi:hypothetical protein
MGERIQAFIERFQQVHNEVILAVERCSEPAWQAHCPDDSRTVGVVAHHIAASYPAVVAMIEAMAMGQPLPPLTQDMIDQANAQHALAHAACTREETLDLLRRNGEAAVLMMQGLRDEDLDRAQSSPATAALIIEQILIGHAQRHLATMQALPGD